MTQITTTDVQNGSTTDATVMNNNFTAVKTVVNGGIDNANIANGASIAVAKLASATNGFMLQIVGGVPAWAASPASALGYGTTLPASPVDGQEYILVDSTTAPTYIWRFRYNSGSSSPYKWEFTGGGDVVVLTAASENTTSSSYTNLTTTGPSFTLPRAGDWDIICEFAGNRTGDGHDIMSYELGATVASDDWAAGSLCWNSSPCGFSRSFRHTGIAASTAVVAKYKTVTSTAIFAQRMLRIRPYRVS